MLNGKRFNGTRLRSARTYRGMTITELADNLGVASKSISQYESNQSFPQFDTLMNIIRTLRFPREYFYEQDNIEISIGNTYFRNSSKMSKKEESMQKEKTKLIGKLFIFLSEYIKFPDLNLPEFDEELSIEYKALKLREYWGLGEDPITDIIYVLEKNGIIISSMHTNSENVDAFSQQQNINGKKHYIIVLGNDKSSATRRQFSVAHELGHIILHDGFLELENMTREELRKIENEAHCFATAFLLPKNAFSKDIQLHPTNPEYYKELKKKWRTSISAMTVRGNQLGIISYNSYQSLMNKMSRLGWKIDEPLDDTLIMSTPTVLRRAIDIILDNGILDELGITKALSLFGLSLDGEEIEILLGLNKGKLMPKHLDSKVIELPLIKRD
ncbi:XRE family transcriptional regulator [Tissierella carlieri]|uniref:XRE family transcriptional regulator n=2 Tax=Tissierella carlieri TaxID=689904 RepID=A0ABT1SER5_9FIRM|nr:XRE family transcriptional regulator [Tissierella carlieri]MCQ4924987.1 XRE family transcriptional regulator [Tissierella carlieri]